MRYEEKLNDSTWLFQFQNGDEAALKEVYELYGSSLLAFATNLLSKEEDARDIVAESFVKLWKRSNAFQSLKKIKAFLFIITRNACFNYLRQQKKLDITQKEYSYLSISTAEPVVNKIIKEEFLNEVHLKIEELPEVARTVFKMVYFDQMEIGQIAEKLNMPLQHVRNNKNRALSLLRIYLFKNELMMISSALLFMALK